LELEVDDIEHYCSDHLYNAENIEDSYLTDSSIYNRSPDLSSTDNDSPPSFSSSSNSDESSHEENNEEVPTIREKLQSWAVKFRSNLTI